MFDYVHTQLSSNCITTSKSQIQQSPPLKKAGFVFYFRASSLNIATESSALTTDATITARTAMS